MPAELLLGVDIGTSSTTASLTSTEGALIAETSRRHLVSRPHPGWAEHDAEQVWWREFVEVCRELVAAAPDSARVAAVAVSGIGPALVVCDEAYTPLRPAILYGIDTRASVEIAELTELFGPEALFERTGEGLNADSVGPKVWWLKKHEPEVYAAARYLLMPQSFVGLRLTGRYGLDVCSVPTPFLNVHTGTWNRDWHELLCPQIEVPELLWPGDELGRVSAAAAAETTLPEGIPVAMGTRDSFADAVSAGLALPGDSVGIYGSTMSVLEVTTDVGNPYVYPGTRNVGAGMATSGALTVWLQQLCGGTPFEQLLTEASDSPPGAHGLLVLPYFAGERSPLGDPNARGTIIGLTTRHTRGDLYRAFLEATGFGLRHCLDELDAAGAVVQAPYAVGGGTRDPLWPQIIADITGRAQRLTTGLTGACHGDAFLAGLAAGLVRRDHTWVDVRAEIEPRAELTGFYDERYRLYRRLHEQTREIQHALASAAQP